MLLGIGDRGGPSTQLHMNVLIWNMAQCCQIFFQGKWKFWIFMWNLPVFKCSKIIKNLYKTLWGKIKTKNPIPKPRSVGWLSSQPPGWRDALWAKRQENWILRAPPKPSSKTLAGHFTSLGLCFFTCKSWGEARWSLWCLLTLKCILLTFQNGFPSWPIFTKLQKAVGEISVAAGILLCRFRDLS